MFLKIGLGEAEVREHVFHWNPAIPVKGIEAGLNGGPVLCGQNLAVVVVNHDLQQLHDSGKFARA